MEVLLNLFTYFIIYSMIGWIAELIWRSLVEEKRFVKEAGFLTGPWCPIYGFGGLMIAYFLKDYQDDLFGLFIISTVMCTILEYITSYVMEKTFGKRWWDYSNYKFNLNGRICLLNSVVFGISAIAFVHFLHPFVVSTIDKLPEVLHIVLVGVVAVIFIFDFVMSLISVLHLKKIFATLNENLKKKIVFRKNIKKLTEAELNKKSKFISFNTLHMLKRFPNLIYGSQKEITKALIGVTDKKRKNSKVKKRKTSDK